MSATLVFPAAAPAAVKDIVESILAANVPSPSTQPPTVFVRVRPLHAVMNGGALAHDARLARDEVPLTFLTVPEGIDAHSPDAVLRRLGYTEGDITAFFGKHPRIAVIVFRYADPVRSLTALDGNLSEDVDKRVVRATWDNVFRSFADLADTDPSPLHFEDDDRRFVASFPAWGRMRLKGVPSFWDIKHEGGSDWRYRSLLHDLLDVTPSFLGNGCAANQAAHEGAPEYLGPNVQLSTLAEQSRLAVLAL